MVSLVLACYLDDVADPEPVDTAPSLDADGDGFSPPHDCNDADPDVHPGVDESCDGVDQDCDGGIDETPTHDATAWYEDIDGDGYAAGYGYIYACAQPAGHVADVGDCDDSDPSLNPGVVDDVYCVDPDPDCVVELDCALGDSADARLRGPPGGETGSRVSMAGDVDGDGRADLLFGGDYGLRLALGETVLAEPDVDLAIAAVSLTSPELLMAVFLPDVDNDGRDEVVAVPYEPGGAWLIPGSELPAAGLPTPIDTWAAPALEGGTRLTTADADGDGRADLFLLDGDDLWVVPGTRPDTLVGASRITSIHSSRSYPAGATAGDVDGDGLRDVLSAVGTSSYDWSGLFLGADGWLGGVTSRSDAAITADVFGHKPEAIALADVDGDGYDDWIAGAPSSTGNYLGSIAIFLDLGHRVGEQLRVSDVRVVGSADFMSVGAELDARDRDGDGRADLVVMGDSVWEVPGTALSGVVTLPDAAFPELTSEYESWSLSVAANGDVDANGSTDILLGEPTWNTGGQALLFLR